MTGWRLLLTRPADESAALASVLSQAGIFSSSLPLLEIEPIAVSDTMREVIQGLDRYCAVIVVSKPAARMGVDLLNQYWPQPPSPRWFSVGAATAQILAAGLLTTITASKRSSLWINSRMLAETGRGSMPKSGKLLLKTPASINTLASAIDSSAGRVSNRRQQVTRDLPRHRPL